MDLAKWMIPAGLANIVLIGIGTLAMPKSQGGVFGFMHEDKGRLIPTGRGILISSSLLSRLQFRLCRGCLSR
jgi:hypothetical protein